MVWIIYKSERLHVISIDTDFILENTSWKFCWEYISLKIILIFSN